MKKWRGWTTTTSGMEPRCYLATTQINDGTSMPATIPSEREVKFITATNVFVMEGALRFVRNKRTNRYFIEMLVVVDEVTWVTQNHHTRFDHHEIPSRKHKRAARVWEYHKITRRLHCIKNLSQEIKFHNIKKISQENTFQHVWNATYLTMNNLNNTHQHFTLCWEDIVLLSHFAEFTLPSYISGSPLCRLTHPFLLKLWRFNMKSYVLLPTLHIMAYLLLF